MKYDEFGVGPTIVMIPGLGTSPVFFKKIASKLSAKYRVIVVSLPGQCNWCKVPVQVTIDNLTSGLRDIFIKLKLKNISLLGWSLGASIAYTYLMTYHECIDRLVSIEQSPYLLNSDDWPHSAFGHLTDESVSMLTHKIGSDFMSFSSDLLTNFTNNTSTFPDGNFDFFLNEVRRCQPDVIKNLFNDVVKKDWRDSLKKCVIPKLFIHGSQSKVYPTNVGQWWLENHYHATLHIFEYSGHLPFIDEPDKFYQVVDDFITNN